MKSEILNIISAPAECDPVGSKSSWPDPATGRCPCKVWYFNLALIDPAN